MSTCPEGPITLAGHDQFLGDLTQTTLLTWLRHRQHA